MIHFYKRPEEGTSLVPNYIVKNVFLSSWFFESTWVGPLFQLIHTSLFSLTYFVFLLENLWGGGGAASPFAPPSEYASGKNLHNLFKLFFSYLNVLMVCVLMFIKIFSILLLKYTLFLTFIYRDFFPCSNSYNFDF